MQNDPNPESVPNDPYDPYDQAINEELEIRNVVGVLDADMKKAIASLTPRQARYKSPPQ